MRRTFLFLPLIFLLTFFSTCPAEVIEVGGLSSGVGLLSIETVLVGNPGNMADTSGDPNLAGAVSYAYRIGKYEVTNSQYSRFLNAVDPMGANTLALYNNSMSSDVIGGIDFNGGAIDGSKYEVKAGHDNKPVVYVSWFDSIRFANWLHNGQGSGDTETGAYMLIGGTPIPSNGSTIAREPGAAWFLPSEDEWYKTAYHKNDGVTGNYWDYPTSSDAPPVAELPAGGANSANYGLAVSTVTDVGAYTLSDSPYGTFDQGGNVIEWNETLVGAVSRGGRGGHWGSNLTNLAALARAQGVPFGESNFVGFRVANIPEPSSAVLLCILLGFMTLSTSHRCFFISC